MSARNEPAFQALSSVNNGVWPRGLKGGVAVLLLVIVAFGGRLVLHGLIRDQLMANLLTFELWAVACLIFATLAYRVAGFPSRGK